MATTRKKTAVPDDAAIHIGQEDIGSFVLTNMRAYGTYVNEDRSVPDLYDGWKPVQRRIMLAASREAASLTKTARVSGATAGVFHPHGTAAIDGAITTLVNAPTPPLFGVGNWGTLISVEAAARYTNVRLSAYGKTFLESDYLAVTPMTPNYDDKDKEPITLPALLPNLLLNGTNGIGVGVTTRIPAFTLPSVLNVLILMLKGRELGPEDYAQRLVLASPYGGTPVRTQANFEKYLGLFTSSYGSVATEGVVEPDYAKRSILVAKFPIGFTESDVESFIETARELPRVRTVHSGNGVSWVVTTDRNIEEEEFTVVANKVQKLLTKSLTYSIYVTDRIPSDPDPQTGLCEFEVKFLRLSVPELLQRWLQRRLQLEKAVSRFRIQRCKDKIARLQLMIHAAKPEHLDIIANALKHRDSKARIMKGLKVTDEQAETILALRVSQLARLLIDESEAEIKALQSQILELRDCVKNPSEPVLTQLRAFKAKIAHRHRDPKNWNCLQFWLDAK